MKFTDVVKISLDNLVRNRRRAALTMLGIVIGVMSVILMLSGQVWKYILSQVSSFLTVDCPQHRAMRYGQGRPIMTAKQTLTLKDYEKLKTKPGNGHQCQCQIRLWSSMRLRPLLHAYRCESG